MKPLILIVALAFLSSCAKESDCVQCTLERRYNDGSQPFTLSETYCHKTQGFIDSLIDRNTFDMIDSNGNKIGSTVTTCD